MNNGNFINQRLRLDGRQWLEELHYYRREHYRPLVMGGGCLRHVAFVGPDQPADYVGVGAGLDQWHQERGFEIQAGFGGLNRREWRKRHHHQHLGATMKFELSEQHVAIIGAALGKAPYDQVAPVIAELQKQINEQQNVRDSDGKAPKATGKVGEGPQEKAA